MKKNTRALCKEKWRRSETGKVDAKNGRVVSPFAMRVRNTTKQETIPSKNSLQFSVDVVSDDSPSFR